MMLVRLAWRSLWRHRRRTVITIASIAFGTAAAIFFVSLSLGMYRSMIDEVVRMQAGHLTLESRGYRDAPGVDLRVGKAPQLREEIASIPAVEKTKLLVLGEGVARSGADAIAVSLMGVEPAVEAATSPLARQIVAGTYLDDPQQARVVIGEVLAERLGLAPGKKLVLSSNDAEGQLVEGLFRVDGVFRTGSEEVDGFLLQTPLAPAQRLYGFAPDEVTQIGVVLRDPGRLDAVREMLPPSDAGEGVAVVSWDEVLPGIAGMIALDWTSNLVLQALLLVLVLFTILNTILMSILERERENAMLLALGTPPGQLRLQVALEALCLGCLGAAAGLALGGGLSWALSVTGLDVSGLLPEGATLSGFALSPHVYPHLTPGGLIGIPLVVVAATVGVASLALRRLGRIEVAETIRGGL